jgi:EAL domain-containing protein (putative c-di-GMP-specific phosphodiesterase class I)/putative methionine-R-sulfoxide reductase with GAF domain
MAIVGYEALARVPLLPRRGPDWWLARADELGMRPRLEIACWRAILELGPPPDDCLLFMNVSPKSLSEPDLLDVRLSLPERVVIEVTEQEAVADYVKLRDDLVPWLSKHVRLAIDDAGAGHSSLRHVIELVPDFIKIDHSLISGIDKDRNRRALVHSLVAFAREVGITVIAEGIENDAELGIVRDADVPLGQGYLLARPGRGWPRSTSVLSEDGDARGRRAWTPFTLGREEPTLRERLRRSTDAKTACEAVVEFLYRHGQMMPSLYLEREGQLRCIANRGLWQVLDGMSGTTGITGRTWATSEPIVVPDVRRSADYIEAIPGVISEICVPLISDGETIGALNVESLTTLTEGTLDLLGHCAELLVERLKAVGWRGSDLPWRHAARASMDISRLALEGQSPGAVIEILRQAAGMDSVGLMKVVDGALRVIAARGPLGDILASLPDAEVAFLAGLVDHVSSCYTANDALGRGFVGTESIRAFARAVIVLPLRSGGARIGTIVLAHSRPRALSGEDVEPLELLAGQIGATLDATALLDRLRHEVTSSRPGERRRARGQRQEEP